MKRRDFLKNTGVATTLSGMGGLLEGSEQDEEICSEESLTSTMIVPEGRTVEFSEPESVQEEYGSASEGSINYDKVDGVKRFDHEIEVYKVKITHGSEEYNTRSSDTGHEVLIPLRSSDPVNSFEDIFDIYRTALFGESASRYFRIEEGLENGRIKLKTGLYNRQEGIGGSQTNHIPCGVHLESDDAHNYEVSKQ